MDDMVIRPFLFPAPNPPHYSTTSHANRLIWLPAEHGSPDEPKIPCMIYPSDNAAKFFMIFAHGNGCDIGSMHSFLEIFSKLNNLHILSFEYPSYGLCHGLGSPNKARINSHAERAYAFIHQTLHWPTDRLLVYGHSLGTGVACHLASTKPIGGLILQSPYTSVQDIIKGIVGYPGHLFGASYWNNLEATKNIHCPTLLIHGERDTLIPAEHSKALFRSLAHVQRKQIVLLPHDDHCSISYQTSISCTISFLREFFPPSYQLLPRIDIDPAFRIPSPTTHAPSSTSSWNPFTSLFGLTTASLNATQSVYNSMLSKEENNE